MSGCLAWTLSSVSQISAVIVEVEPAGEGDLRARRAAAPRSRRGAWRRGSRGCRSSPRSGARWLTIEPVRGRQAEPVWRSNWSAAWSRKSSMALRRSISVRPSAVRRSSSTERTSEPSCSLWLRRCACSLSSSSRSTRSAARWKRLTVDQSRSSRSGSRRVSLRVATRASKMSATAPAMALAFGQRPRVGLVLEGAVAVELQLGEDVVGRGEACAGSKSSRRGRSSW